MSSKVNGRQPGRLMDAPARIQPAQTTTAGLLTLAEVCMLLRVSKSTAERMIRSEPTFPQPHKLKRSRLIRFFAADVQAYLAGLQRAEYDDHAFDPNDETGRT